MLQNEYLNFRCTNRHRYSRERAPRSLGENSIHYSFASLLAVQLACRASARWISDDGVEPTLELDAALLVKAVPRIPAPPGIICADPIWSERQKAV